MIQSQVMNNSNEEHKKIFKEEYFTGYYRAMTGDFTQKDLQRNKNWFYGWFQALRKIYDFEKGNGKKVLEIGSAIGAASSILRDRGFDIIATDISSHAVEHIKELVPDMESQVFDVEEENTKWENTFDVIFSFEVIEHLPDPEKAIKNMHKMLKDGGIVINSTPYPYDYVFIDKTHISVKHPLDWVRIYKQAGFRNVGYVQVGFVPFFYRFSKHLHFTLPIGVNTPYINSPVFIYGEK